ncbi:hypothetical protein WU86_01560 [Corynebacterium xerosis]|nr:hypothetical protein WU86_01560 [Corynebacterium xerosis]
MATVGTTRAVRRSARAMYITQNYSGCTGVSRDRLLGWPTSDGTIRAERNGPAWIDPRGVVKQNS